MPHLSQPKTVEMLGALAHEGRLELFRLLVEAGPEGVSAGELAERLGVPANSLSFHLTRLRYSGLIHSSRSGRNIIYTAHYEAIRDLVGFLTENCCGRSPEGCPPACEPAKSPRSKRKKGRRETSEAVF